MNGEPTLRDIRDLIDGLAQITNAKFERVDATFERLEAKVDAGFAELRSEMRNGFDRVSRRPWLLHSTERVNSSRLLPLASTAVSICALSSYRSAIGLLHGAGRITIGKKQAPSG